MGLRQTVFVSYSKDAADFARHLVARVESAGFSVFLDKTRLKAGGAYDTTLEKQVKACSLFLFLVSARSVRPDAFALSELQWAVTSGRHILGVYVPGHDDVSPPPEISARTLSSTSGDRIANAVTDVRAQLGHPFARTARIFAGITAVLALAAGIGWTIFAPKTEPRPDAAPPAVVARPSDNQAPSASPPPALQERDAPVAQTNSRVTTQPEDRPGTVVLVSFADNLIAQRLPVGVPFSVSGTVDPPVKSLDLTVHHVPTPAAITETLNALQARIDCEDARSGAKPLSQSRGVPDGNGRFTLVVSPLAAANYYAFCFLARTPSVNAAQAAAIDADLRPALAAAIRRGVSGEDPSTLLASLRRTVLNHIREIGGVYSIPTGNFFHENASADARFTALVPPVLESSLNLTGKTRSYHEAFEALSRDVRANRQKLTSDLLSSIPPASRLPSVDSAVLASTPFNFAAYRFESERALLEKAADAAATPEQAQALKTIAVDLRELTDTAETVGKFYEDVRPAAASLLSALMLEARAIDAIKKSVVVGSTIAQR